MLSNPVVTKISSLVLYFVEAVAYVCGGIYGSLHDIGNTNNNNNFLINTNSSHLFHIGSGNAICLILQLITVGIIMVLLDEGHNKGYGISRSFISLIIAVNTCVDITWQLLSPLHAYASGRNQFIGLLPAIIQEMYEYFSMKGASVVKVLHHLFISRGFGLATIANLAATLFLTLAVRKRYIK